MQTWMQKQKKENRVISLWLFGVSFAVQQKKSSRLGLILQYEGMSWAVGDQRTTSKK